MAKILANEQTFYHGKISREEAEGVLSSNYKEGAYLVRVASSSPGDYVLGICANRQTLHFQIKQQGECWYSIDDGPLFEGLPAIINHYRSSADGLPTLLTQPVPKQIRRRDENEGSSPLHAACYQGHDGTVKGLLGKTKDLNVRNKCNRTPLHEAARAGHESIVQLLLAAKGVDINATDDMNWTPLHLAAYYGFESVVRLLLKAGAAPHIRTIDSESPRDVAARTANAEACKLLGHAESGINTDSELAKRDYPYFHGKIGRKPAEHILSKHGSGEGLFLVRESSSAAGDFVLTMSSNGQPFHFQIQAYDRDCFFIDDGPIFEGLAKVIEYYRTTADGLPTQLRQFCRRSSPARVSSEPQVLSPTAAGAPIARDKKKAAAQAPRKSSGAGGDSDSDSDQGYDHMNTPEMLAIQERKKEKKQVEVTVAMPSMISVDQIELGKKELGQGEFGAVFPGVWNQPGGGKIKVAVKTLLKDAQGKGAMEFGREASVMCKLQHPYVVRLLGVCLSQPMMIVQELVALGALLNYLPKNQKTLLKEPEIMVLFAAEIAAGMQYLEEQRMVHRDLATRNILVSTDRIVKISDFGLSRAIGTEDNYYKASAGGKWPVKWYAPESVYYGKFTHKSDAWSFGVTLYEIWTFGAVPYDDLSGREVLELLDRGDRLSKPKDAPDAIYKIMHICWRYNAEERATFEELKLELKKLLPASLAKLLAS